MNHIFFSLSCFFIKSIQTRVAKYYLLVFTCLLLFVSLIGCRKKLPDSSQTIYPPTLTETYYLDSVLLHNNTNQTDSSWILEDFNSHIYDSVVYCNIPNHKNKNRLIFGMSTRDYSYAFQLPDTISYPKAQDYPFVNSVTAFLEGARRASRVVEDNFVPQQYYTSFNGTIHISKVEDGFMSGTYEAYAMRTLPFMGNTMYRWSTFSGHFENILILQR